MAGLNLLPWREKAREQKKKQFFSMVGAGGASAVAILFLGHLYMQATIENQNKRNARLDTEIKELDKQIAQIEALDNTRQALLDRMQIIENLQGTRPAIVHLFDELVNALPKGMYLTHLTQENTTIHLEGKAESYARVSSFMNRLDASPWLKSSNLNIISTDNKAKDKDDTLVLRDFKLDVTQLLKEGGESEEDANPTPASAKTKPKPNNKTTQGGKT